MKYLKNEIFELTVTGITNEGLGVGKLDGYTVFIKDAAPDDVCQIRLTKCNSTYGYGRIEKILKPSDYRILPDCPVYTQCGGCVFRHITYDAELQIKEQIVRDCMERIGKLSVTVEPILGSKEIAEYRNKAQYPVGMENGRLISGFYANHSHRIIPSDSCKLHPAVFGKIQAAVLSEMRRLNIGPYDAVSGKGLLRHIYLRIAKKTGESMLCLVVASCKDKRLVTMSKDLKQQFPELTSIVLNENAQNTNVILGKKCVTAEGTDTITDILCGISVKLSALSFYQVNHDQAEVLYRKAAEYAAPKKSDILLDLYCGAGTIGLSMAKDVKEVIGVEIVPAAIENAKENAHLNQISNARFICADAGEAAASLAAKGVHPDIIIVDPPRKGVSADVIDAVLKMLPSRLVMVSCNPSTAARDVALLEGRGYRAVSVTPVDMFPRTAHVECVVLMARVKD